MDIFRKFFKSKDKKTILYLIALCAAGFLLISLSYTFGKPKNNTSSNTESLLQQYDTSATTEISNKDYETAIEDKLQEILSYIDGAGAVQVMITFSQGAEIVIAGDEAIEESKTNETDSEGGSREVYSNRRTEETLLVRTKDGYETPIVIKELKPKIAGVLVVAEGGGDILVKDALIRAVHTVLDIESHKVQVLKMK